MTIKEASKELNIPEQALRIGIQRGSFSEFAKCWKNKGNRFRYYINRELLNKYLGREVKCLGKDI